MDNGRYVQTRFSNDTRYGLFCIRAYSTLDACIRVSYSEKKKERIPFSLPFEPILLSTRLETLVPEDFEMFVSIANEEADEDGGNF